MPRLRPLAVKSLEPLETSLSIPRVTVPQRLRQLTQRQSVPNRAPAHPLSEQQGYATPHHNIARSERLSGFWPIRSEQRVGYHLPGPLRSCSAGQITPEASGNDGVPIANGSCDNIEASKAGLGRGHRRRRLVRTTFSIWRKFTSEQKQRRLPYMITHASIREPRSVFKILRAVSEDNNLTLPVHTVCEAANKAGIAILSNTATFERKSRPPSTAAASSVFKMLHVLENWAHKPGFFLDTKFLHLLLWYMNRRQVTGFTRLLLRANAVHHQTAQILVTCRRLISLRLTNDALSWLRILPNAELNKSYVQYVCIRLITNVHTLSRQRLHKERLEIVRVLLKHGLESRGALRNTIIQVAMQAGDAQLAWQIYYTTTRRGVHPNEGTFAALLAQEGLSQDHMNWILDRAADNGCLGRAVGMHAIRAVDRAQRANVLGDKPFEAALRIYLRVFNIGPLYELGLISGKGSTNNHSSNITPSPMVINILIRAFCQQYSGSWMLWSCYQRYMHLALTGHRIFARCALFPYASEAFMLGMKGNSEMLRACTEIMQDMIDSPARDKYLHAVTDQEISSGTEAAKATAESGVPDDHQQRHVAEPRGLSWNILLSAIIEARDFAAAEKIVLLMQEKGYRPGLNTWNTLISGYAGTQDIAGVVDAVVKLEADGRKADDFTKRALAKIFDRAALLDALEEASHQRETGAHEGKADLQTKDESHAYQRDKDTVPANADTEYLRVEAVS